VTRAWRPLALVLILAGALPLVGAGRGQAADDPGVPATGPPTRTELVGSASARVAAAGPLFSGLSLETGFATSTVDLSGEAARGESATITAAAASLLLGQVIEQPLVPNPTRADSNGEPDAGRSVAAPAGEFLRVGQEEAHAGPRRSEATTSLGDLTVGEVATVLGGTSDAAIGESGARSTSALGELRLGGAGGAAAVVLSGLRWEARQSLGAPAEGVFSIGAASVGGQPLAVGSPEQLAAAIETINGALAPQGIRLTAPVASAGPGGGGGVGALRIELRDPPLNRAVGSAAYSPLAPTVNAAQEAVVGGSGSDPRVSQALLGANLALAALLGNGGAAVELGGAMASLTQREVPDLGSLFGGGKLPPLPGGSPGDGSGIGGDGSFPAGSLGDGALEPGESLFTGDAGTGSYGELPLTSRGPDLPGAAPDVAADAPPGDAAPTTPTNGAGVRGRSRQERPGRLPAPLAAAALASGLAIVGVDWLARRRTIGLVAGLRSAAGLGSAAGRAARGRHTLVTAGVALVAVLGVTLVPSRVPVKAGVGDEVAAVSPIPPLAGSDPGGTAVPADTGAGTGTTAGANSATGAGTGAGLTAAGGANGKASPAGGANRAAQGAQRVPGANRPGATGATGATGPGRPAASGASGGAGTVTRGRDCPGGELQDRNSTYSPPCLNFSGDNGGATSKGVSADTITIAMREPETFDAGVNNQGRITDTPADIKRSLLAFVEYFNRVYQLYGRKIQVVFYKPKVPALAGAGGGYQEEANADALTVGQQIKAFADVTASAPAYADALVRQGVIGGGTFHMSKSWYQARSPYAWANLPDCTSLSEQSIDYVVKRLGQGQAKWAGDPALRTKPRAIGLVVPDSPWYQECADHAEALYKAAGYKFARRVNYPLDFNTEAQTATNVVAQMKAAGVTTVMCMCDPLLPYFATPQANQQNYHPEWLVAGFGATDTDIAGQFYDQAQWSHAFGMGVIGDLRSGYDSESYRAYKAIRNDEPAQLRDIAYYPLLMFMVCAQMAGPNLTPKTFEAGCFAYPPRQGELGLWKFGPGDYTAVSDAREIYWDPEGVSPWNSRKGRYVTTLGGARFPGAWPQGEPAFPPPK
jgi:hypothetical protein